MKLAVGEVGEGGHIGRAAKGLGIGIRAPWQGCTCTCACMSGFRGGGEGPTRTCEGRGSVAVWHHLERGNMGRDASS
jgi:hypothetical protein